MKFYKDKELKYIISNKKALEMLGNEDWVTFKWRGKQISVFTNMFGDVYIILNKCKFVEISIDNFGNIPVEK